MRKHHMNKQAIALAAAVVVLPSFLGATPITWSGTGTSWNDGTQWTPSQIPVSGDEAIFTNTNTSAKTISLDAAQAVSALTLNMTNAMTIGSASDASSGYKLSLTNITRNDVSGTEGDQTIAAGINLSGNGIWNVAGSGNLKIGGVVTANANNIEKVGTGTLQLSGANVFTTGTISVTNGRLDLNAVSAKDLVIGGGGTNATVGYGTSNAASGAVTVKDKGTLSLGSRTANNVTIEKGGTVTGSYHYVVNTTFKDGGTLTQTGGGGPLYNPSSVTYTTTGAADAATATVSTEFRIYGALTITAADGAAPIDIQFTKPLAPNGGDSRLTKAGAGVVVFSGASTYVRSTATNVGTTINAGTLLVNNVSGSGTGKSKVQVNGGATLGGSGFIGGVDSTYSNANVTLTGASTSSPATLAPGSIDPTSGAVLLGTLTVGSVSQNNSVTFGDYSRLIAQLGNSGSADLLAISGNLNLNSAGNRDALELITVDGSTLSGEYTLATFTDTLTGRFDSVTLNGGALGEYQLLYRDATGASIVTTDPITGGGSIALVVPEPGSAALAISGLVGLFAFRRRSSGRVVAVRF